MGRFSHHPRHKHTYTRTYRCIDGQHERMHACMYTLTENRTDGQMHTRMTVPTKAHTHDCTHDSRHARKDTCARAHAQRCVLLKKTYRILCTARGTVATPLDKLRGKGLLQQGALMTIQGPTRYTAGAQQTTLTKENQTFLPPPTPEPPSIAHGVAPRRASNQNATTEKNIHTRKGGGASRTKAMTMGMRQPAAYR